MEQVAPDTAIGKLLAWCAKQQATDIHAQAAHRYAYRVDGKLLRITPEDFPVPSHQDILKMLQESLSGSVAERIEKQHETDLSFLC